MRELKDEELQCIAGGRSRACRPIPICRPIVKISLSRSKPICRPRPDCGTPPEAL
jgi:hypothetical protein